MSRFTQDYIESLKNFVHAEVIDLMNEMQRRVRAIENAVGLNNPEPEQPVGIEVEPAVPVIAPSVDIAVPVESAVPQVAVALDATTAVISMEAPVASGVFEPVVTVEPPQGSDGP